MNAINQWVRKHVPYSFDPQGPDNDEDYFWHPARVLETYNPDTGKTLPFDCDCHSMLVASMLMALGYTPIFILFAQEDESFYNHIITALILPKQYKNVKHYPYYPIETTRPDKPIDAMPNYLRRCVVEIVPHTMVNAES